MSALEDRLRRDLRAESGQITPDSLPDLHLPGRAGDLAGWVRRGGPRAWTAWVKPLAAAAAVIAVIAGALVLSRAIQSQPPVAGIPPDYSSAPPYYAYTVQGDIYDYVSHGTQYGYGVQGRYIKVRATSTGRLLATVSPPKPYNDFSALTGAANGRIFVFGARHYWEHNAGPSPRLEARDQRTPMVFLLARIAGGHVHLSTLSLPETLTPQQGPSIALSPDGTRLAVAFGRGTSAVVQVITLGSGQVRTWEQPRASWHPVLEGQGAWRGNGRTLMVREEPGTFFLPVEPAKRDQPPAPARVLLLRTSTPGGEPPSGQVVALHAPAGRSAPGAVFLTPDGTQLIGPVSTDRLRDGDSAGELAVYSARTGALLDTLAAWRWPGGFSRPGRGGFPRQQVAWSDVTGGRLIVLQPRGELNVLGVLSGTSFAGIGSAMLPGSAAGYQELQYALRTASQMTW